MKFFKEKENQANNKKSTLSYGGRRNAEPVGLAKAAEQVKETESNVGGCEVTVSLHRMRVGTRAAEEKAIHVLPRPGPRT